MASLAGGFSAGLERGFRLGDMADASREKRKNREREERIETIVGQSFQSTAAPAQPGQPQQPPDYVAQLNGTLSNLMKAAQDPANADIAPHLFDKAGVLAESSKRFGDVMLNQARQRALPHIQTLYNQAATDEQKTKALGTLMNDVFPDGENYTPRVVGKEVHLLDQQGNPVMGADGKPRKLSMDDVDEMITSGLSSPDDYISAVKSSIEVRRKEAKAFAKLKEERAYKERIETQKYKRQRSDKISDRAFTESQKQKDRAHAESLAETKEIRADERARQRGRREFIAKAMASFDKDAAGGLVDPKTRAAYLKQVRATADENFGAGTDAPAAAPAVAEPGLGDTIDADIGEATPQTAAPTVPAAPVQAAAPAPGLPEVPTPGAAPAAPAAQTEAAAPARFNNGRQLMDNLRTSADAVASGIGELGEFLKPGTLDPEKNPVAIAKQNAGKAKVILAQGIRTGDDARLMATMSTLNDRVLTVLGFSREEIAKIRSSQEGLR